MDFRAVIDTNVIFEGLTSKGSASGLIVEAWLTNIFQACVSTSLFFEYLDVFTRKLSPERWVSIQPVLQTMLFHSRYVPIYFRWRPISPDPADEHIIDCAMNAGAQIVTYNVRDFKKANETLGVPIFTPLEFIKVLIEES